MLGSIIVMMWHLAASSRRSRHASMLQFGFSEQLFRLSKALALRTGVVVAFVMFWSGRSPTDIEAKPIGNDLWELSDLLGVSERSALKRGTVAKDDDSPSEDSRKAKAS